MRDLLVLSGGHPYEAEPFAALLASLDGWRVEHLVHPEAEAQVADGAAEKADALLFYDMPGFTFANGTVTTRPPSPGFVAGIKAHFAHGKGAVALHHALAGWADWPEWAEMLGGKFLYRPETLRGRECLDSGYRHDVEYQAVMLRDHPVTQGLPPRFAVCDELYLAEIFAERVTPLIAADHDFVAHNFHSAAHAVAGRMFDNSAWPHPPGSHLIGWTKPVAAGQLVYLQFGDGPAAYANPHVRQMLANALDYVTQDESGGRRA
ncbi:hypothetical protein C7451_10359 [Blastomonas natatoria]|uniref:ThuA-like domain-containing protein n=1 Tax=Blastomonas natatoria TaxID=34015 RepID=A0A2V3V9Y6_9SPHN|nr:ThuA domain-containing protein [Blastomonas natatoria]PXW77954.1 hypothetical protein C7451_10359 [Blastomonas natatoria]